MWTMFHKILTETAPELLPKTWYGMPAYANADGKVICYFQWAEKFEARYAPFGFNDGALLDDGNMWPITFALSKPTVTDENIIKGCCIRRRADQTAESKRLLQALHAGRVYEHGKKHWPYFSYYTNTISTSSNGSPHSGQIFGGRVLSSGSQPHLDQIEQTPALTQRFLEKVT